MFRLSPRTSIRWNTSRKVDMPVDGRGTVMMSWIRISLCALSMSVLPSQASAQSGGWLYFKITGGCPVLKYGVVDYSKNCLSRLTYAESADGYFSMTFFTDGGGSIVFSGREIDSETLDEDTIGVIQLVQVIKTSPGGSKTDIMPSHDQIFGVCRSGNIYGNSARVVCRAVFRDAGQDIKIKGEFVTDGQTPKATRVAPAE